jgi:hypothetical protein
MPERILWQRGNPALPTPTAPSEDITNDQLIEMGRVLSEIKQAECKAAALQLSPPPAPDLPLAPLCRHVMPSGRRCRAFRLKHEKYCYYHLRLHFRQQTRRDKWPVDLDDIPHVEDRASVQVNLEYVVRALLTDTIADRKAGLLLYALQLAMNNTRNDDQTLIPAETVTDIHHGDYYFEQDVVSAEDDDAIAAERLAAGYRPVIKKEAFPQEETDLHRLAHLNPDGTPAPEAVAAGERLGLDPVTRQPKVSDCEMPCGVVAGAGSACDETSDAK